VLSTDPPSLQLASLQPRVRAESRLHVRRDQRHVPIPPDIPSGRPVIGEESRPAPESQFQQAQTKISAGPGRRACVPVLVVYFFSRQSGQFNKCFFQGSRAVERKGKRNKLNFVSVRTIKG